MNRIHQTVFNRRLGVWQVTSERGRRMGKAGRAANKLVVALALGTATGAAFAQVFIDSGQTVTVPSAGQPSPWNVGSNLYVRDNSTLIIEQGGSVSSQNSYIGSGFSDEGTVIVRGAQSSWSTNNIYLYSGSLKIEAGGAVTSATGFLGNNDPVVVTVTGHDSIWTLSNFISFGGNGVTLSIDDGGRVSAPGVDFGPMSNNVTVNLNGTVGSRGILSTGYVSASGGPAYFNWNGGILQATANGTSFFDGFSAGSVNVQAGGAFFDTQNFNVGIPDSSVLTGVGGLTKLGTGTLTLAGSNTYGGNTTVSAGTLRFTNYNQSASQVLGIGAASTSNYGKLVVDQIAQFDPNAKIDVNVAGANTLASGQTLAGVITAGTLDANTFDVTDNSALFDFAATINGNSVDLNILLAGGGSGGGGGGFSGVADAVDANDLGSARGAAAVLDRVIAAAPGGDMGTVVTAFGSLGTQGEVSQAAAQTLPLLSGGVTQTTVGMLSSFNSVVQNRLGSVNNVAGLQDGASGLSGGDSMAAFANRAAWAKAFGSLANQHDADGTSGFSSESWGMAVGADGELDRHTRIGVAYAYANSSVSGNTALSGTRQHANVDSHLLALYGSRLLQNDLQLDWQADIGRNGIDGTRQIRFGGLDRTAESNYASYSAHAGAGLSKAFALNAATTMAPGIRADYTWLRDDSYRESGADALNLDVDSTTTEAFVLTAEGRLRHALSDSSTLDANIGIGYDLINDRNTIVSTYAGAPGQSFTTRGIEPSPWIVSGGFGWTMQASRNMQVTLRYDAEGRDDYLNQTASVKINWTF